MNPSIFKAYDVRGVYPTQINEDVAHAIGRAFVVWLEERLDGFKDHRIIVAGRDGRQSSPALSSALQKGITDQGAHVVDIGVVSSDQFYFACGHFDAPGVTVTASHNPKEYNGMKFVKRLPYFLSGQEGIEDLREIVERGAFPPASEIGTIRKESIREAFVETMLMIVPPSTLRPLVVVADTANGVGGPVVEDVAARLPIQLTHLFAEVDGAFPNHPADPLQADNRKELERVMREQGADVGFAFDGDADRCFIIDERGTVVPNDFLGVLIARAILAQHPQATFLYDVRSSWAFPQEVERLGGRTLMNRVGHAFIKPRMITEGALYGVEVSGHHYFKEFYYCDSGVLPMLFVLRLLSGATQSMSSMVQYLRERYHGSGERNYHVQDVAEVLTRLKQHYSTAPKAYELDGISIEYADWHFNVRPSNTEPLLRLNLESIVSKEHMEEKLKEVEAIISQ